MNAPDTFDLRRPDKRARRSTSLVEGGMAGEVYYTDEENELLAAVARYRAVNQVGYVSCTDVLWILQQLGWRAPEDGIS